MKVHFAFLLWLFVANTSLAFYNSQIGRWTSRDPIGEIGGINLHGFVRNTVCGETDFLGLFDDGYEDVCVEWERGWERDEHGNVYWVELCVRIERRPSKYKGHAQFTNNDSKCPFDYTAEDYGWSGPLNYPLGTARHFRNKEDVAKDLDNAIDSCDAEGFQSFMHQYQDTEVHYDKGYRWWKFGHAFELDGNPDNDNAAWERAEKATKEFVSKWNATCKLRNPKCCASGWIRQDETK